VEDRLHKSQVDNFVRGMNMIYETGLFDVSYAVAEGNSQRVFAAFGEPDYMELEGLVVVNLREFREAPSVASAVVYRVLSRLFEARDEELARGAAPSPTFIFIDEAHYNLPQEGAREDFNKEVVEAVINKLTRLGRVRKMGVVFATHSPANLNDLVIQLTNTKIAMRSEPKVLERVDMAEYAGELAYAQSGAAAAKSFIYKTHAVPSKLCRPRRDTEDSSNSPTLFQRGSVSSLAPSLQCLRRGFRLVAKGAGFCIPGGSRTSADL
jgi:hypothetical protein